MSKKKTLEEFILEARSVHGNKYDYSKTEYVNANVKVCIICPIHGEFWQTPHKHLMKRGCPMCAGNVTKTLKKFISDAKKVHGNRYDYSKVNYKNSHTKVCIICPEHGEFWVTPCNHLNGVDCPKCVGKEKMNNEIFEIKAREVHGNRYDYSKVEYMDNKTKVCIICSEHGEFWQKPNSHLSGQGCPKCSGHYLYDTNEFIKRAKEIHGDKYDYSKVDYVNTETKVCIVCPEHGEFWQTPHSHLRGSGCPICIKYKMEVMVGDKFPYFERQKKFNWMTNIRCMSLDFYCDKLNIAVECQGEQHFIGDKNFRIYMNFDKVVMRDELKYKLCKEHNIEILYYFPEKFLDYNVDFYKDKKCFHSIVDLKKYIDNL